MRRSNSSSHIPVPKNLFSTDKTRKRSSSMTRTSVRISNAKQSLPGQAKYTPVPTSKRGRSLTKGTPGSEQKGRNPLGSGSALKSQEKKTIQKLSTDGRWVAEQYEKVRNFIATSGLFDLNIVTENNIKPPSIKAFIYITNVLLSELYFNKINLTNANYKEVIAEKLKVLKYPGTMANSILKTVNTMHVWPQVIGLWGWLIDKVNLPLERTDYADNTILTQCFAITKASKQFILDKYSAFNNGEEETRSPAIHEEYRKRLLDILELDIGKYEKMEKDLEHHKEYKLQQEREVNNLIETIKQEKDELSRLLEEIEKLDEEHEAKETIMKTEIEQISKKLEKVGDRRTVLLQNIEELQLSIEKQSCSYQEKIELLKTINSLNADIKVKREKMEHAQKVKQEFDHDLNNHFYKLQEKIISWNRFLMKWVIIKPQLQPLLLKETGFHNPSYLNEVNEVNERKLQIENDLTKEECELSSKLKSEKALYKKLLSEWEDLQKKYNKLKDECSNLRHYCQETEDNLRKLKIAREEMEKNFKQEMALLCANKDITNLKNQVLLLKETKESLEKETENLSMKCLTFFVDLNNQVTQNISNLKEVITNSLRNALAAEISLDRDLGKILQEF